MPVSLQPWVLAAPPSCGTSCLGVSRGARDPPAPEYFSAPLLHPQGLGGLKVLLRGRDFRIPGGNSRGSVPLAGLAEDEIFWGALNNPTISSVHQFVCKNDKCIPFWWKCDTEDDCGDRSDEPEDCRECQGVTQPPRVGTAPWRGGGRDQWGHTCPRVGIVPRSSARARSWVLGPCRESQRGRAGV